jgi:hypothetical protein
MRKGPVSDVDPLFTAGLVCTSLGIALAVLIGPIAAVLVAIGVVLTLVGRHRAMTSFGERYDAHQP